MSKYTTGEMARLGGVTVRTVQYYDARGILTPDELSEGGRRLYSEESLQRLRVICFLRELGLPIDAIAQLLREEHPENVISLLLEQQERDLREEIGERQEKLGRLEELKKELRSVVHPSVESIGDIAFHMTNKSKLKKLRRNMVLAGLPLSLLQCASIVLWAVKGIWQLFAVWAVLAVPFGILISRYYLKNTAYICPECHKAFKPRAREAIFASHTPTTRRLTCTACGHHGFCVETWGGDAE